MNDNDTYMIKQILTTYEGLGEKKLIKKIVKDIQINKKLYLLYFKRRLVPICTLPRLRLILVSKQGFISFCFNFFSFLYSKKIFINISPTNIASIAKFVIYHEVGHILDSNIQKNRSEYTQILTNFIDKLIEYDVDVDLNNLHKQNLPAEVEECVINLKKNLIERESIAWNIAYEILDIKDKNEELIFNSMREYALATYNFGNIKNIISENNIDMFLKYKKVI
ncbi:MAG: hypothetical protein ACRDB0_07725 [Paraclostridium sp.]